MFYCFRIGHLYNIKVEKNINVYNKQQQTITY